MIDDDDCADFWIGTALTRRLEVTDRGVLVDDLHRFAVDARADGFSARFEGETMLGDLARFRDEVEAMHVTLEGSAALRFIDDSVRIDGHVNRYGHVRWQIGLVCHYGEERSALEFDIHEDQTMLWNVVAKIGAMLEAAAGRAE